jgi:hemoglobin
MWLEYIRYRFRLDKNHDLLELTQVAALKGLRNSARCRSWRVLPAVDDPSLLILEIEWDPGAELTPFRGSEEFATIHSALALQAHSLEEADYSVDDRLLRRVLGGPETLFRLAEDIVVGVLAEPSLAWHFQSDDGSRRGRLGLWLLEVLGGPDLFSSSFPGASTREGPLANDRLDLEERERLLEIATNALPQTLEEQGRCVVGNLRAHLPLHPAPPSLLTPTLLPGPRRELLESAASSSEADGAATPEASTDAPDSDVWHARQYAPEAAPGHSPGAAAPEPEASELDAPEVDGSACDALASAPIAAPGGPDAAPAEEASEPPAAAPAPAKPERASQTGVRSCVDEAAPAARAAGHPWPHRSRPSPSLRGRSTGRWPRWRDRSR